MEKEKIQDITKRTVGRDIGPKNFNIVVRPFSHGPSSPFQPWQPSWKNDHEKTQDLTKRRIGRDMVQLEEESRAKKSNLVVRPFSHGPSSAFRPWKSSWKSTSLGKQDNYKESNFGRIEKNHINGGSATAEKTHDLTKRKIGRDMVQLEEQPGPKNSNLVIRPFSHGVSSAFRPWQPSWKSISLGKREASSSGVKSNLVHVEKNHINGGSATAGASVCDQEAQKMNPKRLKRILANRAAARKSRIRKLDYIADLERTEKSLQDKLSFLRPQIEVYKNQQWMLQVEHHQLKHEVAAREKERILQEVEINNMRAEVNRLRELQKKQMGST